MAFETFIRKITKDGYINKSEAEDARKKGVNFQSIQDYYGKRNLKVRDSAEKIFNSMSTPAQNPPPNPPPKPTPDPVTAPPPAPTPDPPQQDPYEDQVNDMGGRIDDLVELMKDRQLDFDKRFNKQTSDYETLLKEERDAFDTKLGGLKTELQEQEKSYTDQLDSMQSTLMGQMNPATRNPVLGVRFAGNKNTSRQGVNTTFGRKGSRIQGIKNTTLNLN